MAGRMASARRVAMPRGRVVWCAHVHLCGEAVQCDDVTGDRGGLLWCSQGRATRARDGA